MVAAKGWLSEATVVQTPPSVAAGSDAHLSCLCVSIVRSRLRAKRAKRRGNLWLIVLLGKKMKKLKMSCILPAECACYSFLLHFLNSVEWIVNYTIQKDNRNICDTLSLFPIYNKRQFLKNKIYSLSCDLLICLKFVRYKNLDWWNNNPINLIT